MPADVEEGAQLAVAHTRDDDRRAARTRRDVGAGLRQLARMTGVLPRRAEDALLLAAQNLGVGIPAVRERSLHSLNLSRGSLPVPLRRGRSTPGRELHEGASTRL